MSEKPFRQWPSSVGPVFYQEALDAINPIPPQPAPAETAHDILLKAAQLVSGDRDRQHGAKEQNFENIVALWNAYLGDQLVSPITAVQGPLMMALLKIGRTKSGALNIDDYIDGPGYMGCAGEIALKRARGDQP